MFDTEYNPSGNSNRSFDVGADILNVLFLYDFFTFFQKHIYHFSLSLYYIKD